MVNVNNKKFKIYDLDTLESIINRIASQMKTLPKYLYFPFTPKLEDFKGNLNLVVTDNLQQIREDAKSNLEFGKFYLKILPQLSNKINSRDDVLYVWCAYNPELMDSPQKGHMRLLIIEEVKELNKKLKTENQPVIAKPNLEEFFDTQIDEVIPNLKKEIAEHSQKTTEQLQSFQAFQKVEAKEYTPFELEKIEFEVELDISAPLLEIFDLMVLSRNVPFASVGQFYKIFKDFVPPLEWTIATPLAIITQVLKTRTVPVKLTQDDYIEIKTAIDTNEQGETQTLARVNWDLKSQLTSDETVNRYLSTFVTRKVSVVSTRQNEISGVFYIPGLSFDQYVFADLVMNNEFFSIYLSIYERDKTTKKKAGVYVHFSDPRHPELGTISASLTGKIAVKSDSDLKGKDLQQFPIGEPYLRAKVSHALNLQSVENFQSILSSLFSIYEDEFQNIVKYYRKFIPDFAKKEKKVVKSVKRTLKGIAPEMFVTNYARHCTHPPTIVDEKEAKKWKGQSMLFPKTPEEGPQYYFICNNPDYPKHIYPGLFLNKLRNSDKYPYLPCCYLSDQMNRKGSLYRKYYFDEEEVKGTTGKQARLVTTDKILKQNKMGRLPSNIAKFFRTLDPDYEYGRKGVARGHSSFLQCVVEAVDADFRSKTDKEMAQRLLNLRKHFTKEEVSVCRQELYDQSTPEIRKTISDPKVYLDPSYYLRILEVNYKVRIFIFKRDDLFPDGEMVLPRHLQAYYQFKSNLPAIFIYEHMGAEADLAKYPQCELIVRYDPEDVTKTYYQHSPKTQIYQQIDRIYQKMTQAYALNQPIPRIELPNLKVVSQDIDTFGKARVLRVKHKNKIVECLTTPIPPLSVPEVRAQRTQSKPDDAISFFSAHKGVVLSQSNAEIHGRIGNVYITIPLSKPSGAHIPMREVALIPSNEPSQLDKFTHNKKLAKYLIEYFVYMFSEFASKTSYKGDATIRQFISKKVTQDSNFVYGEVSKKFDLKQSGVIDKGKLVVLSEEMLKRLVYVLRLALIQNQNKVLRYHLRESMEGYYSDITDFQSHPYEVILQGEDSVEKWVRERTLRHLLFDRINLTESEIDMPYFFSNPRISNEIYLAQNTENLPGAEGASVVWNQNGFNSLGLMQTTGYHFNLFAYASKLDIQKYEVKGKNGGEINILGYKVDDEPKYTTLLKLPS